MPKQSWFKFYWSKLLLVGVVAFLWFANPTPVQADQPSCSTSAFGFTYQISSSNGLTPGGIVYENDTDEYPPFRVSVFGLNPNSEYKLLLDKNISQCLSSCSAAEIESTANSEGSIIFSSEDDRFFSATATNERDNGSIDDTYTRKVEIETPSGAKCELFRYQIGPFSKTLSCGTITMSQNGKKCIAADGGKVNVTFSGVAYADGTPYSGQARLERAGGDIWDGDFNGDDFGFTFDNGSKSFSLTPNGSAGETYWFRVRLNSASSENICPQYNYELRDNCNNAEDGEIILDTDDGDGESSPDDSDYAICNQIPAELEAAHEECLSCIESGGISTAIGCIEKEPTSVVQTFIKVGISIAGGVALLMILAAGFLFTTSQGDPKRTTEAKELMTSAVVGIFFVVFSVSILQFVGLTLFQLPGFGN